MTEYLKIRIDRDDDGSAGLIAEVRSGFFSGKGEAWFNVIEINKFKNRLKDFVKNRENPHGQE